MKALLVSVAVLIGQMNTLQEKQVVHLQPHSGAIRADFGGKLVELQNAPTIVYLPMAPPKLDSKGNPWSVDIKNMGPGIVTVIGASQFSFRIIVGRTVHVLSNGISYSLR
jgi:starvation-inducible outer membrane lipoprotein